MEGPTEYTYVYAAIDEWHLGKEFSHISVASNPPPLAL